jgi:putative transposase
LDFLLWQSRNVYNAALDQRIKTYQETGKGIGYGAQWEHFRDLRHNSPDTPGVLNASSLLYMLRRLKASETLGYPRFKGRNHFKSLEYTYGDGCKLRQNEHGRMSLYVQNVGELSLCYHRSVPAGAAIKHAVVKRIHEGWYVSLMLELPQPETAKAKIGQQVGIDVGLYSLAATSSGELIENPGWLRVSLSDLRRNQRHAARQVKGSRRQ